MLIHPVHMETYQRAPETARAIQYTGENQKEIEEVCLDATIIKETGSTERTLGDVATYLRIKGNYKIELLMFPGDYLVLNWKENKSVDVLSEERFNERYPTKLIKEGNTT